MKLSAPALRSHALLFVALTSIISVSTAKEPTVATARKAVVSDSSSSSKSPADKPWWVSLTIQEGQPTAKPIAGLSPSNRDAGLFLANGAKPALFPSNSHPSSLSPRSATNLPLSTLAPRQGFAGAPRRGFAENAPISGILDPMPHQPMIAGDASGNGTINFVDISAAMQLDNASVVPPLGGIAK